VERRDVIIVGAGPAGAATALRLAQRAPHLAGGTVLLDKARHPRSNTCAGGLIPKAPPHLAVLDVELDVPSAPVDVAGIAVPGAQLSIAARGLCRVIRRRELDAALAWAARDRGVELCSDARVIGLVRENGGVRVDTTAGAWWAPVVVGADGTGSLVRRALVPGDGGVVARAVMADVPCASTGWDGFAARRYDFDFQACTGGLRGYAWAFPCVIDGAPHVNVGAYALPPVDGPRLQAELAAELSRIGATASGWKAFPVRTYTPTARLAAPNALLVGDAAGVDPLMGEGISFALEYGILAADHVVEAHRRRTFDVAAYEAAVHRGPIGHKLARLVGGAARFYGPRGRLWFGLARLSPRAQRIGLAWYNGVDGWDRRNRWDALRALARPRMEAEWGV
jgi:flavin-dependent dehydrogenase